MMRSQCRTQCIRLCGTYRTSEPAMRERARLNASQAAMFCVFCSLAHSTRCTTLRSHRHSIDLAACRAAIEHQHATETLRRSSPNMEISKPRTDAGTCISPRRQMRPRHAASVATSADRPAKSNIAQRKGFWTGSQNPLQF